MRPDRSRLEKISMTDLAFVTDLHGKKDRYNKLFEYLRKDPPDILCIGGDILPPFGADDKSFTHNFLSAGFAALKEELGPAYPAVLLILGNDDPAVFESSVIDAGGGGLWTYLNMDRRKIGGFTFFGYSFVPPTPFMLKDWERYDVSRYTDIGCVSPEEGQRTVMVSDHDMKWTTIKDDLDALAGAELMEDAVFLFHAPPYQSQLDKGDLGGKMIDHVPIDDHLGSIAVKQLIEDRQPLLSLHGHIHESTRMTGNWQDKIGRTVCINGSHDGAELSVIRLPLEAPDNAERFLL